MRCPLSAEIKELQAQSQAAGENGDVDASMAMQKQAEALLAQKDTLENPQFPGKEKVTCSATPRQTPSTRP